MALLTLSGIEQSYGGPPLLEDLQLRIEARERIALIGANGVGKSTLFGIISGELQADAGALWRSPGLRLGLMPQHFPDDLHGSVREVISAGLGELGTLLNRYHRQGGAPSAGAPLEQRIDVLQGWAADQRIESLLSRMALDPRADYAALSGGYQRRVLLARALAVDPQLLLLDEPTNHLDPGTIEWFENMLSGFRGCVLFTTHDRRFLEHLAGRIIELDRGRLRSWPGDYRNYLRRRDERLQAEQLQQAREDKKLAAEEAWIRQGIKARRTRNEGRVRKLQELRRQRQARREQPGRVRMRVQQAEASGKRVIEACAVDGGYGDRLLIRNFSILIQRGDRVAIIGPNGAGKTTLLKLLLGELAPLQGQVLHGTHLRLAYFDQHRRLLDADVSVMDSIAAGKQEVSIGGRPRHVISYLEDFLFTPERARGPVSVLSGGERNRLLLARLFAEESNLLVMDEPTNDLDMDTLELLEERLGEYAGTVLLVSHDRQFIDNIVTSTLVLEGGGRIGDYVGGYTDWLRQRPAPAMPDRAASTTAPRPAPSKPVKKLSYRQQRELERLPGDIETLERRTGELQARLSDPEFYRRDGAAIAAVNADLKAAQAELDQLYQRWSELEALA